MPKLFCKYRFYLTVYCSYEFFPGKLFTYRLCNVFRILSCYGIAEFLNIFFCKEKEK